MDKGETQEEAPVEATAPSTTLAREPALDVWKTIERRVHELLGAKDRRGALILIMDAYGAPILGFCMRMLQHRTRAEDVRQQVFEQVIRDLDDWKGANLRAWLFTIAKNRCLDSIKAARVVQRRMETTEVALEKHDASDRADRLIHRSQLLNALDDCLSQLTPTARHAVELRFQGALSYVEMAQVLEEKADTLNRRVARALEMVRTCLQGKGWRHE